MEEHHGADTRRCRDTEELDIVKRAALLSDHSMDLCNLVEKVLDMSLKWIGFDAGCIYVVTRIAGNAELLCARGLPPDFVEAERFTRISEELHRSFYTGKMSFVSDLSSGMPDSRLTGIGFSSLASIPLLDQERAVGLLNIFSRKNRPLSNKEKKMLEIMGYQAGHAVSKIQREEALRESEEESRFLAAQLLGAQEQERRRISRELHDEVGQALITMKLQLRQIEKGLQIGQRSLKKSCADLLCYVDGVVENVRRLTKGLSPLIVENLGLQSAIRWLSEALENDHQIRFSVQAKDLDQVLSKDVQSALYRIFQEAFTNISRHADATLITIIIEEQDQRIRFIIEDNGKGFNTGGFQKSGISKGLGLYTMDQHARVAGGSLDIWSKKGMGTKITISIPISIRRSS